MAEQLTVVLTRPEGENEGLAEKLRQASLKWIASIRVHPMVQLVPLDVTPAMRKVAQDLDQIDKLIFVSKSAVRYTLPLLDSFWPQWPVATEWYAVGQGTAGALAAFGVQAAFPARAGSEGLLALLSLQQVAAARIMIVRGRGGRALLGEELERRGASVDYFETYERLAVKESDLKNLSTPAIIVVTSGEILETVRDNIADKIQSHRIVAASERIAEIARKMGVGQVLNAGGASDQALYDAIVKLAGQPEDST